MSEEVRKTIVDELAAQFGEDVVERCPDFRGETACVVPVARLLDVLTYLKERKPSFNMLVDVCGADYPEREKRFEVVYHLLNMTHVERVRIKTRVSEIEEPPTATSLWLGANWFEREVFDMFGIRFKGHPNMSRILMWDGYDGHPLRKDFPLKGNTPPEERYHEKDIRRTRDMKQYCWEGYCTHL